MLFNNKNYKIPNVISGLLFAALLILVSGFGLTGTVLAAPTTGCYQEVSTGGASEAAAYQTVDNSVCNGQPTTSTPAGKADPTTTCYVETTALDGSTVWDPDCSAISSSNTVTAGTTNNSSGSTIPQANSTPSGGTLNLSAPPTDTANDGHVCGGPGYTQVHTAIDIGCQQLGNPITDLVFAIIRFLSIGVGIVVIGSLVVAGIQFSASRGDPQSTGKAIERIRSTAIALLIYIFAYAMLNYVIPMGFFNR